jgi:hypothetical protein
MVSELCMPNRMEIAPRRLSLLFLIFGVLVVSICGATAGNITKLPGGIKCEDLFNDDQPICYLELQLGTINSHTPEGVHYLIDHRDSYPRKISGSVVSLDSLGGDLTAAMEIGKIAHDQKLRVMVGPSAKCVSACVFVLAAGTQRKIRGVVGIHRPYFATLGDATSPELVWRNYGELLKRAKDYLVSMSASPRLLDEMLRIEPNDVRFLSRAELDGFGLGEGPPSGNIENLAALKEAVAVKSAAAYRLSRIEYNRRAALIDRTCALDSYQSPFEPIDFSAYGRTEEELRMSPGALRAHDLEREEDGWAHCYKMIMIHGK